MALAINLFFVVLIFKYPTYSGYSGLIEKFDAHYKEYIPFKETDKKISRYQEDAIFARDNYLELKSFLDKNVPQPATFLDFSNTPMLYFYTQRNVPSYFNQYMQNTVDGYLQRENLKKLSATMFRWWFIPMSRNRGLILRMGWKILFGIV